MNGSRFLFHSQDVYNETASPEGPPSAPPTGGSAGGARVVTPDSPFSVEDMTSDSIFYVQDGRLKAPASRDAFSFYISDGHSQTEAVSVEIDIQVGVSAVLLGLQDQPASLPAQAFPPLCRVKTGSPWCRSAASTWRRTPGSSSPTPPSESWTTTLRRTRSSSRSSGSPPTVRALV